ncbi:MAG: hypothetical protein DPW18_02395 [Chloroflexi bacterium]|nr:hypothetical protein [Chloroflexota bacterium]MDL1942701.1 hypothetical protein [Chloroflexi bacterium CFX2]
MESVSTKKFLQTWLWSLVVVSLLAIPQTIQRTNELEIALLRSKWIGLVGVFALTALAAAWLARSPLLDRLASYFSELGSHPKPLLSLAGVLLVLGGFTSVWFVRLQVFGNILPQVMPILWVFLWASLIQTIGLKLIRKLEWHTAFAIVLLAQGMIYQTYGIFSITSANPFSMGYSEAGRHYYASLFFSEKLYGMELPLPFLHPSRYLLLSIPFLIDGLPLWFHRFWQAFLWFGLTLAASFLLARRMKLSNGNVPRSGMTVLITAWAFLFFLQGAVYYHLQVMVILILAGVSVKHQWRSLIFIVLASLWAGISRVNWFPVPAMLAIAIYILETPINDKGWKYWVTPFIWGASGLAAALISQFVYIRISGSPDLSAFGSSFTSDLIWSRLLPNETFPMGILPGILLVSAPLFAALYQMLRNPPLPKGEGIGVRALHPLRWLALLAMLFLLFAGGVVVSTKIGGGGDLHNMDAYLVMLSLLTTSLWAKQASPEKDAQPMDGRIGWGVAFAALLIPLGFAIRHIGFFPSYDKTIAEKDIQRLQEAIQNGGEILFITERQLITFDDLHGVRLVPEYEQMELMEMAMSRNRVYLENYYADLRARRFDLIVAEDQKFTEQKEGAFVEENVAWVRFVGAPLLCNYKPVVTLTSNNIQVFEPRSRQVECKDPFSE